MNLKEAAGFLGMTREKALTLIDAGVKLPRSQQVVKLTATKVGEEYDVTEQNLDAFIACFEAEEPGRHPPTAVRRELFVEAKHRCAICDDSAPLQCHHMLDWGKLPHHDPKHMLAVCGTDHDKCSNGFIDYKAQLIYKAKLLGRKEAEQTAPAAHAAKHREADLKTLTNLFSCFHSGIFETFLDYAKDELVMKQPLLHFWLGFEASVDSPKFHLFDKTLLSIIKDLKISWGRILSFDGWLRETGNRRLERFRDDLWNVPGWQDARRDFRRWTDEADAAYRLLFEYLKEFYPEFDMNATDKAAYQDYIDYQK
jgi:hypothetical protein